MSISIARASEQLDPQCSTPLYQIHKAFAV